MPLQMVLDKSGTDDQLLEALREEIARLKAQQQLQQHPAGKSHSDGITSKFGGSTIRSSGQQVLRSSSFSAAAGSLGGDSLDFLQSQQAQQQESWEAEQRQMQGEIQRLRRLCKNQVRMCTHCVFVLLLGCAFSLVSPLCLCGFRRISWRRRTALFDS